MYIDLHFLYKSTLPNFAFNSLILKKCWTRILPAKSIKQTSLSTTKVIVKTKKTQNQPDFYLILFIQNFWCKKVKTIKFLQIFIVPEISYVSIIGLKLTITKKLKYKKAFEKKERMKFLEVCSIAHNNNSWKPLQPERRIFGCTQKKL